MAINIKITPINHYDSEFVFTQRPTAGIGTADTFDGTTTTAATVGDSGESLIDRYNAMRFWDGFIDGGVFQHALDGRYKTNSQIKIIIYWTTNTSTSGSAYLKSGLAQEGADGILGDDTDTEYIAFATYTAPTSTNQVIATTFTFSGSLHGGLVAGDPLAFILIRDSVSANDTINDQFKLLSIAWKYTINTLGT